MAQFIPLGGAVYEVRAVLDIGDLQQFVGGFVRFMDIGSGNHVVCHEDAELVYSKNALASSLSQRPVHGPAIICRMKELEL
jgi:hypothetical protein